MKRKPTCIKKRAFPGDLEFHQSDTESSDSENFSSMKGTVESLIRTNVLEET
jgi:hypothetical protein